MAVGLRALCTVFSAYAQYGSRLPVRSADE